MESKNKTLEAKKAEVELLDSFIKLSSEYLVQELESHKMKIKDNKLLAENDPNNKAFLLWSLPRILQENERMDRTESKTMRLN